MALRVARRARRGRYTEGGDDVPMAKKTRKSRRSRKRTTQPVQQPQAASSQQQEAAAPATTTAAAKTQRRTARASADFVREYAYVYFDLSKMFTLAVVMFIFLIVTNILVTRFLLF